MRNSARPRTDIDAAATALESIFGYGSFRTGQREIIEALIAGEDVFALMPTGAGKSMLYQLPAAIGFAPVVVVSPLISLMRDQIAGLTAHGVAAGALNSGNEPEENAATMALIAERRIKLLYVAPERLALADTIDILKRLRPKLLAVDEAHCVSRWGHDFRPDYAGVGAVARKIGDPQTIAVTATAAPRTRDDIEAMLFHRKPRRFVQSFHRPNISVSFRRRRHVLVDVAGVIRAHPGQSGIVYCGTRAATESLAKSLAASGAPALAYHAGMDAAARSAHQDEFHARHDGVMVATIAFGMGIDKKDVRYICHADLPQSIEAYYQEIGRAGRDGLSAEAIAFASRRSLAYDPTTFADAAMDGRADDRAAMVDLAQTYDCRWRSILAHLGETGAPCGTCDNCRRKLVWLRGAAAAPRRMANFGRRLAHRWAGGATAWEGPEAIDGEMIDAWSETPDRAPMTTDAARVLARLRSARAEIARRRAVAPSRILDEAAMEELARFSVAGCEGDESGCPALARAHREAPELAEIATAERRNRQG